MAFCLWMTGLPCSGKTTIVRKLAETIPNLAILDGDELRNGSHQKISQKRQEMSITEESLICQNYF